MVCLMVRYVFGSNGDTAIVVQQKLDLCPKWANYHDIHLEFDEDGKLFTRLYDQRDDLDFPIVNFPYLSFQKPLHMVFLFNSWYVMFGFVRNMKIFCSEDLFWFQSYWSRDILHGNFRLLFGNSMFIIHDLVRKFDTSVSHMLNGLFTNYDIWLVSSYLG